MITTIIVTVFLVVLITLFLFTSLVLALWQRPREPYRATPKSKSTPLGYYSAQQGKRVAHGTAGSRVYFDEEPTEKMEARH